ncbi:MAG: glutathione S-transferase C-terminal domain-containing protein, partial [Stellaceae bacterium]
LCVAEIDRLMADHPFLAGPYLSLADLLAAPLFYYFGNVPEGRAPLAEHPRLQNWLNRIESRQSFAVTKPPPI